MDSANATRTTLLGRVCDYSDSESWNEFDALYRPMLMRYARARGLDDSTAEEIAQQCLVAIVKQIREFKRTRSFRAWLRAMVNHKVCDYHAHRQHNSNGLPHAAGSIVDESQTTRLWEQTWNSAHLQKSIDSLRGAFAAHTLKAFELYVLDERPVEEICSLLGMTPNQVYVAKNRVIRYLKEKCGGWLDDLYGATP